MTDAFGILVVDDDRLSRVSTAKQLKNIGYEAEAVESAYKALLELERRPWNVVLTDLRMPGMDGLEFLREAKQRFPGIEVILMTAYATVETAVQAMQEGASDYLMKPFQFQELELRLKRMRREWKNQRELETLRQILGEVGESSGIIGQSLEIQKVRERIHRFADTAAPVLITGDTGTGKELVARALHTEGHWSAGEFVAVGCGTIPRELAESELFGHEKGAFTGATQARKGSFQRADGGTLLLDDVDDLELDLQVKLLRVLQEGTFVRVGGGSETEVQVRVVATTKVDLEKEIEEGRFRADLFYRLRGLEIHVPPLRERGEDVVLLADHFLHVAAAARNEQAKRLSPEAAGILRAYRWPGNVRELRRAMESAEVFSSGEEIVPAHLPDFLLSPGKKNDLFSVHLEGRVEVPFAEAVQELENRLLRWALMRSGGKQSEAARILGLPRTTFQSKIADLE